MKRGLFIRLVVCIGFLGGCLYSYLSLQNQIAQLQIHIPQLATEVRKAKEESAHFRCDIERFESPENLLEIAGTSAFAHLRFPIGSAVVTLKQARPLEPQHMSPKPQISKSQIHLATRAPAK